MVMTTQQQQQQQRGGSRVVQEACSGCFLFRCPSRPHLLGLAAEEGGGDSLCAWEEEEGGHRATREVTEVTAVAVEGRRAHENTVSETRSSSNSSNVSNNECVSSSGSERSGWREEEEEFPSWLLGADVLDDEEEEGGDLTLDEEGVLSFLNHSFTSAKSFFVSVDALHCSRVLSAEGKDLLLAEGGKRRACVTFIVLLPPRTCADVAQLIPLEEKIRDNNNNNNNNKKKKKKKKKKKGDLSSIQITSDVQEFISTDVAEAMRRPVDLEVFPLMASSTRSDAEVKKIEKQESACAARKNDEIAWLCTQSSGGELTHFAHPSTYFAVDFRCDVGTPVVAIFDGVVVDVRQESSVTGVHVSNLFSWNSILLKKSASLPEEELFAEYVHIQCSSATVSVGEEVSKGQVICLSGEAGFCPEPHLHLQLTRSSAPDAASVPITYRGKEITAGEYYS